MTSDLIVLHVDSETWFRPSLPQPRENEEHRRSPGPRAFHSAVAVGHYVYIYGGRGVSNEERWRGDLWRLDTNTWEWLEVEVAGEGEGGAPLRPEGRELASLSLTLDGQLILFGGNEKGGWKNDVWAIDAIAENSKPPAWRRVRVAPGGFSPPPRGGAACSIVDDRLIIFGGEGTNATILGDLWSLRGLSEGEARWTQLHIPGTRPAARRGHAVAPLGSNLLIYYGGHGDDGWLRKNNVYFDDVTILDRLGSVHWEKVAMMETAGAGTGVVAGPGPRAYHTLTSLEDGRILLLGGYDGNAVVDNAWWLEINTSAVDENGSKALASSSPRNKAEAATTSKGGSSSSSSFLQGIFGITRLTGAASSLGSKAQGTSGSGSQGTRSASGSSLSSSPTDQAIHSAMGGGDGNGSVPSGVSTQRGNNAEFNALRQKFGLQAITTPTPNSNSPVPVDAALIALGARQQSLLGHGNNGDLGRNGSSGFSAQDAACTARDFLKKLTVDTMQIGDIPALLQDHRRATDSLNAYQLRTASEMEDLLCLRSFSRFAHLGKHLGGEIRMGDIASLLHAYHETLSKLESVSILDPII